ncbi:hypothetical protein VN0280_07870 [Helicobacter pylori]|uniref:hypothetical protein n=1 Tax=Helicobacter pylori TaxID=210 RepID=UPI000EAE1C75|nr:hypothetical protein [Helicobacter pylori]TPH87782.1 hypothetical protein FIM47_01025 [Helicobacter pylori]GHP27019.1 hypothetical protein VN0211_07040 [Helicobacter pylori]GHP53560.1 hypothetical protein VN0227_05560 [Helicobacter pylori]GHP58370.1 hypothetical protein VN1193_03800 [Helicobacter pylori]GHQ12933.1 hypothetical protein VN0280_07870 [Helicobacter pylori]
MIKIKPQIKKNNPSKSHYSTGWNIFGAVCLIGEIVFTLFGRNKKDKKNNSWVIQKSNFIRQVACV